MIETIQQLFVQEVIIPLITGIGVAITGYFSYLSKGKLTKNSDDFSLKFKEVTDNIENINTNINTLKYSVDAINKIHKQETKRHNFLKNCDNIINETTKFTNNNTLNNYLLFKGEEIRDAAYNIALIYPDINQFNNEYLNKIVEKLKTSINNKCSESLGKEFALKIYSSTEPFIEMLQSDILGIINDTILNNKVHRFFTVVEQFLISNLSMTIRKWNEYETNKKTT